MDYVPIDIKRELLLLLDLKSVYSLSKTNKIFHQLITNEAFWQLQIHYEQKPPKYKWLQLYFELKSDQIKRVQVYINSNFSSYQYVYPSDTFDNFIQYTPDCTLDDYKTSSYKLYNHVLCRQGEKLIDAAYFLLIGSINPRKDYSINKIFLRLTAINIVHSKYLKCTFCGANNLDCPDEASERVGHGMGSWDDPVFSIYCDVCGQVARESCL